MRSTAFPSRTRAMSRSNQANGSPLPATNGTGKSSLLRVIGGLSTPAVGTVKLDGTPAGQLANTSRRNAIGIASPEMPLVAGSISKNIRYRQPGATPEQLDHACKSAGLTEWADGCDARLNIRIGADGTGLSDGEIARVKLARAILGTPRLLLLDEIEQGLDRS